jgi:hypothetical protein
MTVGVALAALLSAQAPARTDGPAKKPKLTLKADTLFGLSASRVRLIAHLEGGADDDQEFYCPKIVWEWSDGTKSESAFDCKPYQAGRTEITRYFTVDHVFLSGDHRVRVRLLSAAGKEVASAGTNFIVR